MISKQILIDFINVQKAMEVTDVKCNSKRLSFVAPTCVKSIIVDTFEPLSCTVTFSDFDSKNTHYVIQ